MNPVDEKLDWKRLYAGLIVAGLAAKTPLSMDILEHAFNMAEIMVELEEFNG